MKNDLITFFKITFDAILIMLIGGALALLLGSRLLGGNLLVVLSQSMEPTVPMGSLVVSGPVAASDVEVGDVITFHAPDPAGGSSLVTHRVIEVVGADGIGVRFRTQGDAVEDPDMTPVYPRNLVGRVWLTLPFAGYLLAFLNTRSGFLLFVAVPAAFLIVGEVVEILVAGGRKPGQRARRPSQSAFTPTAFRSRAGNIQQPSARTPRNRGGKST
jgi:signal peptidase